MRAELGELYETAELRCTNCGRFGGDVVAPLGGPFQPAWVRLPGTPEGSWVRLVPGRLMSCARCHGRVRVEERDRQRRKAGEALPWQAVQPRQRPVRAESHLRRGELSLPGNRPV